MINNTKCIICLSGSVQIILDLGSQPPSNRFLKKDKLDDDRYPLRLGICSTCNHIQLVEPMPVGMVSPQVDWISYNEPESHLNNVVARLIELPGIDVNSIFFGLTYKEDTSIARLNNIGYCNTFRFDPQKHFSLSPVAGLEKIQAVVTPSVMEEIINQKGQADLIFVRHILEHAHNPIAFIEAIKKTVKKGGYLVFEVPDSLRFMCLYDYPFVWEEHISYFTEQSLKKFIKHQGLQLIELIRYPYTFEDSLVVITRLSNEQDPVLIKDEVDEHDVGINFGNHFNLMKERVTRRLSDYKNKGQKVGIFGAGHLAVKFLNFFELSNMVDMVLDDHPDKQGLLMPGSSIPIVSSKNLDKLDLCLLSLSPESEDKILKKYYSYQESGGEFRSIFSASPNSIFSV